MSGLSSICLATGILGFCLRITPNAPKAGSSGNFLGLLAVSTSHFWQTAHITPQAHSPLQLGGSPPTASAPHMPFSQELDFGSSQLLASPSVFFSANPSIPMKHPATIHKQVCQNSQCSTVRPKAATPWSELECLVWVPHRSKSPSVVPAPAA